MPFIDRLRLVHAAIKLWHEVLRETHKNLDEEQDIGDEPEDAVYGNEVCRVVGDLIVFDYNESCDEEVECEVICNGVKDSAGALLLRRMCWLEDEDGLYDEEDASRVQERVGGEEDKVVEEDA